mgnify:CR=1 FL=1
MVPPILLALIFPIASVIVPLLVKGELPIENSEPVIARLEIVPVLEGVTFVKATLVLPRFKSLSFVFTAKLLPPLTSNSVLTCRALIFHQNLIIGTYRYSIDCITVL